MKEIIYTENDFKFLDKLPSGWVKPDKFQDLFEIADLTKEVNAINMTLKEGMEYLVYSELQRRYRYNTLHPSMDRQILLEYFKRGILFIRIKDRDKKKKPITIQRNLFSS